MKLHHIGVVISSEDEVAVWRDRFGLRELCRDHVPAYDCECIFMGDDSGSRIELILAGGGGSHKFRPGLHHIAFQSDNLAGSAAALAGHGMPLVEPAPVLGAFGLLINFLAPAYTRGVRIELVQEPAGWPGNRCRGAAAER